MKLREFFTAEGVSLNLQAESKDEVLKELVALLRLDPKSEGILFKTLKRRENLIHRVVGTNSNAMNMDEPFRKSELACHRFEAPRRKPLAATATSG